MKIKTLRDKILFGVIVACTVTAAIAIWKMRTPSEGWQEDTVEKIVEPEYLYGICIDSLNVESGEVEPGQTLSTLFDKYGVGAQMVDKIVQASKGVFDARNFRGGNNYTVMTTNDTLSTLKYFVYETNATEYIVFNLSDTIRVTKDQKEVTRKRLQKSAKIESSLWNSMISNGMNATLAMNLSDVFQWSIDFYAIQKGDEFNVVYDELFIEDKSIGVGTIYGAWFNHNGKRYYAIRHEYTDDKGNLVHGYWDNEGKSLKSAFLKAPLKYSRISSRFSHSRMHPILRIRRPHLGVDYAAPSGTPVQAIGDGTVIMRRYSGGGGNTIKIKHARNYTSGYLHLKGYAKNLKVGSRVSQGQVIAYVGTTGTSTGPHLDFRIWRGTTAIDPLKLTDVKGEDISSKYRVGFMNTRDKVIAELDGKTYDVPAADTLKADSSKLKK
ncbi:MAG: peptidoglycan DD-metalloendopeptidase family protein [Rikenellaceae bacterium]